ncbi:MAG: hypothetical protein ABI645_11110 [Pseudomonadota bacterium]
MTTYVLHGEVRLAPVQPLWFTGILLIFGHSLGSHRTLITTACIADTLSCQQDIGMRA